MIKTSLLLSFIFFFSDCHIKPGEHQPERMVITSIADATKVIATHTAGCIYEMIERSKDPQKAEKAQRILPQMMEVHHLADKASVIIQTCIGKIRSGGDDFAVQTISPVLIEELFDTLKRFKSELLNTDERIKEFFKESRFQWALTLPTGDDNFESYYKKHFDETDHEEKLLYFYMLQMDMLLIENKTMTYCLNEYNSNTHGYTKLSFLAGLSATSVIPSEIIEITAGMGSFETNRTWKVEIDGVAVPISELGVGLYKFKAESQVGTHTKMVKIYYTDEYGNNQVCSRKIEYEVINRCP